MNRTRKYFPALAAATLAAGLAVATAPALRAQAQSDTNASSAAQPSVDTQQRLQDLEKEMLLLQKEIVSLKESETASVKTASYAQPTAADPAVVAQAPAAAAPADTKVTIAGLLGPTTISGFVDAYYGYNYNHPIIQSPFDPTFSGNGLQAFTNNTNNFALNMAEVIVDKAPDATSAESRAGYHIAAGYGQAAAVVNGSDFTNGDGSNFYLKEAYMSYLAPIGKGLTIQVGKFVTPAGAEVIESNGNWNYTRSVLFYYAIPFFHFGANAKYVFNPKWALTGYLVNGWNNSSICHDCVGQSSSLMYGASLAYTPNAKWSAIENYFAGPQLDFTSEDPSRVTNWRELSDTVISYTPNAKWAFMLNGDYGFGPKEYTCETSGCDDDGVTGIHAAALPPGVVQVGKEATWWGVAGYGKYTINPKSYFAVRYEYYDDPQGYTLFGDFSNLDRTHVQEATATYSYNLTSGLQVRGEYRFDYASEPIFVESNFNQVKKQNTATLGFIYTFSSANAK
jgi:Putative beta-barrel porin-2, OmpL-like. bbp2